MNSILVKQLMFTSKHLLYLFIIQAIAGQLLMANDSSGQSLEEIHISLSVESLKLTDVFSDIEKQTDFTFTYSSEINKAKDRISLSAEKENLRSVLENISKQSHFNFKRINNNIYVIKRDEGSNMQPLVEEQPAIMVTGKIVDDTNGEGLPGVSILLEGSGSGAVSDIDGIMPWKYLMKTAF